jgi:hypothetical protein
LFALVANQFALVVELEFGVLAVFLEGDFVNGLAAFGLAIDVLDGGGAGMDANFIFESDGKFLKADFLRVDGENERASTKRGG